MTDGSDTLARRQTYRYVSVYSSRSRKWSRFAPTTHMQLCLVYFFLYTFAVFGRVVKGMDVCTAIENTKTDKFDKPVDEIRIHSVDLE